MNTGSRYMGFVARLMGPEPGRINWHTWAQLLRGAWDLPGLEVHWDSPVASSGPCILPVSAEHCWAVEVTSILGSECSRKGPSESLLFGAPD